MVYIFVSSSLVYATSGPKKTLIIHVIKMFTILNDGKMFCEVFLPSLKSMGEAQRLEMVPERLTPDLHDVLVPAEMMETKLSSDLCFERTVIY